MKDTDKETADFSIDSSGKWYHNGSPIKRDRLAKLFSDRALKIDAHGNYWLQTPYEKYAVDVEDVPYVAVDYEVKDGIVIFRTNMHETLSLTKGTQWELRDEIPYFEVRDGLFAKLRRSVFYNLVEEYGDQVESDGVSFPLGKTDG